MSDHEFNNYLTLLAGLLRLGAKQRAAIAEELRTHLEDRLEELLARGASRDQAIQQALAEFGDAAGLAAQFVSISRGRRRRWLMRVTTFSAAAMVLIAAGIAIFWPGRNAGPGAAIVAAQAPKEAAQPKGEPVSGKERRLEDVLNQRLDLDFSETPLRDVAARLTERTGVTFHVNAKALIDSGADPDSPMTAHFRGLRLSTMLELMLSDLDLTYTERAGELIVITTPDDAESRLENRVYDCRDLLAMEAPPGSDQFVPRPRAGLSGMGGLFALQEEPPKKSDAAAAPPSPPARPAGGGMGGIGGDADSLPISIHDLRAERLINLITANVAPQSWDEVGGPGSISEYNGLIVVAQTVQIHREVEHVLNMLREAAGLDGSKAKVVR